MKKIPSWMGRSELMMGPEPIEKLMNSHVLVAGLGGVGGIAAEMLARAGVGKISLVDADVVEETNRNRQAAALISTEGKLKTEIIAERIRDINPDTEVIVHSIFLREKITEEILDLHKYDYALDCIDTLSPKVFYLRACVLRNIPVVSSMGAGGKIDPTQVKVDDLYKSRHCNLARYVRKRLRTLGIKKGIKVVYSPEFADPERIIPAPDENPKKSIIGTISYMPAVFGCTAASVCIRDLAGLKSYSPEIPKKIK
ncbi:MAG: tRNA threonylcarbamoyladenosine dehydratase [Bacteroidia bacterium]